MASTGGSVSYREFEGRSNQLAHLLVEHGLETLDHYSIFMENNNRYFESCAAGERSGMYYTCINSYLTADEMAYILTNSQSQLVITSSATLAAVVDAMPTSAAVSLILAMFVVPHWSV